MEDEREIEIQMTSEGGMQEIKEKEGNRIDEEELKIGEEVMIKEEMVVEDEEVVKEDVSDQPENEAGHSSKNVGKSEATQDGSH
ncbi:hypothetical protein GE061_014403 [Apolygus lucorum]|uniref:Uncharacterized protein n=1 Tax=Apolygus lucorum TaxID=248454 RepID=A0A8S9XT62_APOLU|nr:hypothetical protein GE061_014403 [Apolygus lucorum]